MWDSVLNYSVYTLSGHGSGWSVTDGGLSASAQQVKEASKVKESLEVSHREGGGTIERANCAKERLQITSSFFSDESLASEYLSVRSIKPNLLQRESLLKDVKR